LLTTGLLGRPLQVVRLSPWDRVFDAIHPSRLSAARMHFGVNVPKANAVDAYPNPRHFLSKARRECLNRTLQRSAINILVWAAEQGRCR
jgi:hypothetical protein